jgi:hypothetical protein
MATALGANSGGPSREIVKVCGSVALIANSEVIDRRHWAAGFPTIADREI